MPHALYSQNLHSRSGPAGSPFIFKRVLHSLCAVVAALAFTLPAGAQGLASTQTPIRIWGHGHRGQGYIQTLLTAWQNGFRKTHPDVQFDDTLYGNASAIGSLFTDTGDLAIMDREASFIERDAFLQGAGYRPFGIPVAQGSVDIVHHARPLVVYVNQANPLTHLTLQQLDGIFDADHRRGNRTYKTWGDLGLTGDWASKPIQLKTYAIESAKIQFFERAGLKGSQKFTCCMTLFHDRPGASAEQQIAAALKADRYAMALSVPQPDLKPIALSSTPAAPPVLATTQSITGGTYPLARTIYIYCKRKPGSPVPPKVAAFLAYVVSPEGQAIAAHTGGYLPLSPQLAATAKESLQ
ncbi:MAG: substrate-binding domain-containing protein [Edaphobacter sp.]